MIFCTDDDEAFSLTEDEYVARYAAYGMDRGYALFVRTVQRGELDPRIGPID
jgi:hypothetical protein